MKNTAVYFHIPFCDHKCIYCDFYSIISYENIDLYLEALKKEIKYYAKLYSENRIINTIFFGGGTPSFMTPGFIETLIIELSKNFSLAKNVEVTMETNPGTVNYTKLKDFKSGGINRISIGVQSFDENELKFLTRIHDKNTAIQTIENSDKAGFDNISIDLIFSLPNQSFSTWKENLEIAISLPITHISAYSLILERGTILNKMVLDGKIKMTDENHDAKLYEYTMNFLNDSGFFQYEVSNYAKKDFECLHNLYYWQHKEYLSFGTSAHSFIKDKRWWNYSSLKKYIYEIDKNNNAVRGEELLSNSEKLKEKIMLGLRSKGIDTSDIKNYSKEWYIEKKNIIDKYCNKGLLAKNDNVIRCTSSGYLLCDEIITNLL